jgi:heme-degrading monooxygenase HmoA
VQSQREFKDAGAHARKNRYTTSSQHAEEEVEDEEDVLD